MLAKFSFDYSWIMFCLLFFLLIPRAFKINELKAEVTNHLAALEKRVECK